MIENITKIELPIQGMTCLNCAININKTLKKLPGIINSNVSLATDSAILEFDKSLLNFQKIKNSIESLGYRVFARNENDLESETFEKELEREYKSQKIKFIIAISLTIPIILLNMELIPLPDFKLVNLSKYLVIFIFSSVVLFYSGWQFFTGFYKSLKNLYADMNTLIAIGTSTAYLYSTYMLFQVLISNTVLPPIHIYYDTSVTIISFILLGKLLEKRARRKSSSAIKKLLDLQPKSVKVIRNNFEMIIPVEFVNVGDTITITPGEKIPVDGKIISGSSFIDESLITGESLPVEKNIDDSVIGGTINKFGSFNFVAEKIGKNTYLSQIIKLVKDAQNSKAPIQKYADRVASFFVPAIIIIAIITFIYWFFFYSQNSLYLAMLNFVSVLIIACPCALGLATPTAIITGIGKGAENGIFFKNSESLETTRKLDTIIFDKTGTITKGSLEVVEIFQITQISKNEILTIAASCESSSEHPVGKAIVNKAIEMNLKLMNVSNFIAISGYGIKANIENNEVLIGNLSLMKNKNIQFEKELENRINNFGSDGTIPVIIVKNKVIIGIIVLSDIIKSNAPEIIAKLKKLNLHISLLSGDNKETTNMIASQISVDDYFSEVKPEQKLEIVKKMQEEGNTVAMVGDGINDAPALIQSDLGIALGTGTDVAISSADITIAKGDLESVYKAIVLSRKTVKIIKQNLFWAFFYNLICIPIAAGVLYPFFGILLNPAFAALAMAFSSVSVVTNSLRLKRIKLSL